MVLNSSWLPGELESSSHPNPSLFAAPDLESLHTTSITSAHALPTAKPVSVSSPITVPMPMSAAPLLGATIILETLLTYWLIPNLTLSVNQDLAWWMGSFPVLGWAPSLVLFHAWVIPTTPTVIKCHWLLHKKNKQATKRSHSAEFLFIHFTVYFSPSKLTFLLLSQKRCPLGFTGPNSSPGVFRVFKNKYCFVTQTHSSYIKASNTEKHQYRSNKPSQLRWKMVKGVESSLTRTAKGPKYNRNTWPHSGKGDAK